MKAPSSGPSAGPAFHEAGTLLGTRDLTSDLTVSPVLKDRGPMTGEGPRSRGARAAPSPDPDLVAARVSRGRGWWWLLVPLVLAGGGAWWWFGNPGSGGIPGAGAGDDGVPGALSPVAADLPGNAGGIDAGAPETTAAADAPVAPEDAGGPVQPAREPVTVRIVGTPPGAVVRRQPDGAVLGALPLDLVVSFGQTHRLRVEAKGFRSADLEIDWEAARRQAERTVRLERKAPGREAPTDDWEL